MSKTDTRTSTYFCEDSPDIFINRTRRRNVIIDDDDELSQMSVEVDLKKFNTSDLEAFKILLNYFIENTNNTETMFGIVMNMWSSEQLKK